MMTRPMPSVASPTSLPSLTLAPVLSTGRASLDQRLPGGGWPLGGLVEVISDAPTVVPLLLPALRALAWEARWVMLIEPPEAVLVQLERRRDIDLSNWLLIHEHPRLGPLAMAERALSAGTAAALVVWAPDVTGAQLEAVRRAQTDPQTLVFLIRPQGAALSAPNGLLRVTARVLPPDGLSVQVLHTPWSAVSSAAPSAATASEPPLALNG